MKNLLLWAVVGILAALWAVRRSKNQRRRSR